jgi:hypothetical protein
MLPQALPHDMNPPQSPSVFDKFHQAAVYAFEKDDLKPLYTEKTALGFHYIVYCIFLLTGEAIILIKDHSTSLNTAGTKNPLYSSLVEEFKVHIRGAVMPMKFLQFVLSSTVFKRHIAVWTNDAECLDILLPKWMEKKDNLIYGKSDKFWRN